MASRSRDDYTAACICALPLELAAACAMLDERHDPLPLEPNSRDNNNYVLGRVKDHNVVVACLPYGVTGTVSAARLVNQMLSTFRYIKFGLMIGIGGGAPSSANDIRLGDIVVGSPRGLHGGVIQYDFGKTLQHGRFERTGMLNKPPEVLLTALSNIQARHYMEGHKIETTIREMVAKYPLMGFQYARPAEETDRLYRSDYEHPESQATCSSCGSEQAVLRPLRDSKVMQPYIHYGLIASGDQVVKNGGMRDKLRRELDVLCFEMEAAGLVDSFPCLVIRGISDYADSHKNDLWQGYAAATAAAYAKELMQVMPAERSAHSIFGKGVDSTTGAVDVRFRVQEWLSPASFTDDLYNHEKECMDGSCDWSLAKYQVQTFLTSRASNILRIGGAPGSGKSTLTAFLIRNIIGSSTGPVIYFFCKDTGEGRSEPFQALRTLLSQLLVLVDGDHLYGSMDKLRVQSGQKHAKSVATLLGAFQHALTFLPDAGLPFWVVIDGLDECNNGCLLAAALADSLNATRRPFKLLFASREEPDILDVFRRLDEQVATLKHAEVLELSILPSYVRRPVTAYVKQRISQIRHIKTTALGPEVIVEVAAAADGSWLYARLMIDEIQRLPSAASVVRHLRAIPGGLVDLYRTIFSTLENTFSSVELNFSQQLFLWIDLQDFVQVGRGELDAEILDIVFQAADSGEKVFDPIELAKALCAPLVALRTIHKQGHNSTETAVRVTLVHHTAMQFVRQSAERDPLSPTPTILKPQVLKALYRARTAVWYFSNSDKATSLLHFLTANRARYYYSKESCYFEMAYALWDAFFLRDLPAGLDESDLESASVLMNELTDFLLSSREHCLKWIEIATIINYEGGFKKLYGNVCATLMAAQESLDKRGGQRSLPAYKDFAVARMQFFSDYAYVISTTGPADRLQRTAPDGFDNRPLALDLMRIGRRWAHLCSVRV
ncbi:uncharacterized protein DSM5745_00697 [Aspergillus mulundensis]|uniref:Uncharacterized protein n=1 Tax=Aspergillus mulundensis TaxID=1810919 RepID=A0A3D8T497_9EURO|nr:Uncharacterized protein DSM5745_00697 [Aspergillus mulundensis]RDW93375.1 Uncharacterized protein DSM5745_00697 [Aspergillus mulundensis]